MSVHCGDKVNLFIIAFEIFSIVSLFFWLCYVSLVYGRDFML
jgi:hypothetical protein